MAMLGDGKNGLNCACVAPYIYIYIYNDLGVILLEECIFLFGMSIARAMVE